MFSRTRVQLPASPQTILINMNTNGVNIVFYGRDQCGDCDAAKGVFTQEGVIFDYRDVRQEPEAQSEIVRICEGLGREQPAVPVIVIHDFDPVEGRDSHIVFVEPQEGPGLEALRGAIRPYRGTGNPEM